MDIYLSNYIYYLMHTDLREFLIILRLWLSQPFGSALPKHGTPPQRWEEHDERLMS